MLNKNSSTAFLGFVLFLCLISQNAHADDLPMIIEMEIWYVMLFIPIVLLKAWVFKKYLPKVGFGKLIGTNAASNAFSTFIAVPITWWFLFRIELYLLYDVLLYDHWSEPHYMSMWSKLPPFLIYVLQAPWLGYRDSNWIGPISSEYYSMIVGAAMILLIPFFFVSVWAETFIMKKFFKSEDPKYIKCITRTANLLSYGFLYIIAAVCLAYILWKY